MFLLKDIKERKLLFSFYIAIYVLLMLVLVCRFFKPSLYLISMGLMYVIVTMSQYFDLNYKYSVIYGLIILFICPFLLVFDYRQIAEYFVNYVYGFLALGFIGYFLDGFRKRLIINRKFRKYRIIVLVLFFLVIGITISINYDYIIETAHKLPWF